MPSNDTLLLIAGGTVVLILDFVEVHRLIIFILVVVAFALYTKYKNNALWRRTVNHPMESVIKWAAQQQAATAALVASVGQGHGHSHGHGGAHDFRAPPPPSSPATPTRSSAAPFVNHKLKHFIGGAAYFENLLATLFDLAARSQRGEVTASVQMMGWAFSPHHKLNKNHETLIDAVKSLAAAKVHCYVLFWKLEPGLLYMDKYVDVMKTDTPLLIEALSAIEPQEFVHFIGHGTLSRWSHHQKHISIVEVSSKSGSGGEGAVRCTTFTGGLDITHGRYCDSRKVCFANELSTSDPTRAIYEQHFSNGYGGNRQDPRVWIQKGSVETRLPWQDVQVRVSGMSSFVMLRNFWVMWERATGEELMSGFAPLESRVITKDADGLSPDVRTLIPASTDAPSARFTSIHDTMVELIASSKKYIYMENQYFMSSGEPTGQIQNQIAKSIVARIVRAIKAREDLKVFIVSPLFPEPPIAEYAFYQYETRTFVRKAICDEANVPCADKWITFLYLRRDFSSEAQSPLVKAKSTMTSCPIYVHSKVTIVDDEVALIGSANVNDRSLVSGRDSEAAALIRDTTFARNLRTCLWSEHFGVTELKVPEPHAAHGKARNPTSSDQRFCPMPDELLEVQLHPKQPSLPVRGQQPSAIKNFTDVFE